MTKIFVTCGEYNLEEIQDDIGMRSLPFSEGQTDIWTCKHVTTYKATYPAKYKVLN